MEASSVRISSRVPALNVAMMLSAFTLLPKPSSSQEPVKQPTTPVIAAQNKVQPPAPERRLSLNELLSRIESPANGSNSPYIEGLTRVTIYDKDFNSVRSVKLTGAVGESQNKAQQIYHDAIGATISVRNINEISIDSINPLDLNNPKKEYFVTFDDAFLLSSQEFRDTCRNQIDSEPNIQVGAYEVKPSHSSRGIVLYVCDGQIVGSVELPSSSLDNNIDSVEICGVTISGRLSDYGPDITKCLSRVIIRDEAMCKVIQAYTSYLLQAQVIEEVLSKFESKLSRPLTAEDGLGGLDVEDKNALLSEVGRRIEVNTTGTAPSEFIPAALTATHDLEALVVEFIRERNRIVDARAASQSSARDSAGYARGQGGKEESTDSRGTTEGEERRSEAEKSSNNTEESETKVGAAIESGGPVGPKAKFSIDHKSGSVHTEGDRKLEAEGHSATITRGFVRSTTQVTGRNIIGKSQLTNTGFSVLSGSFSKNFKIGDLTTVKWTSGSCPMSITWDDVNRLTQIDQEFTRVSQLVLQDIDEVFRNLRDEYSLRSSIGALNAALEGKSYEQEELSKNPEYDLLEIRNGKPIPMALLRRYFASRDILVTTATTQHEVAYLNHLHEESKRIMREAPQVIPSLERIKKQLEAKLLAAGQGGSQGESDAETSSRIRRRTQLLIEGAK